MLPFPPDHELTFDEALDVLLDEHVIDFVTASLVSGSWHPSIMLGALLQLNRDVYGEFMWVQPRGRMYTLTSQDWGIPFVEGQTEEEALENGLIRAATNLIRKNDG